MPRSWAWVCWLLLSTPLAATAGDVDRSKVARDIPYSEADARTKLDVYAPAEGGNHPVVVWVHGGGWRRGDKANVDEKPRAFNARGYVFVAVNYRLPPAGTHQQQAEDVARAARWVRDHIKEYGGDPNRIALGGHSAGAHLTALVATDGRYLEKAGVKLAGLAGAFLLDGAAYDVPRQIERARLPAIRTLYLDAFTQDEKAQREASPVSHIAKGKGIPPFLILHIANREDSKEQADELAARLRGAGGEARVVAAEDKTHATINRDLGKPGDAPTEEVFEFLGDRFRKTP